MKKAAIFDFDGTMRKGDSIVTYLFYAWRRKALSTGDFLLTALCVPPYVLRLISDDALKTRALRFERKLTAGEREQLDEGFVRDRLIDGIDEKALAEWRACQAQGYEMILLSASTENYMRFVGRALNADALLCTPVLPDGRVRGNCRGGEKTRRVRAYLAGLPEEEQIDLSASRAYGDSKSDLDILRLTGAPHAVNPKRGLRKAAEKEGIPILVWR